MQSTDYTMQHPPLFPKDADAIVAIVGPCYISKLRRGSRSVPSPYVTFREWYKLAISEQMPLDAWHWPNDNDRSVFITASTLLKQMMRAEKQTWAIATDQCEPWMAPGQRIRPDQLEPINRKKGRSPTIY
jgi:hypothetical protein